jgi:hypothetical protein
MQVGAALMTDELHCIAAAVAAAVAAAAAAGAEGPSSCYRQL